MARTDMVRRIRQRHEALLQGPDRRRLENAAIRMTELVATGALNLDRLGHILHLSNGGARLHRQLESERSELLRQGESSYLAYQRYAASILALGMIISQDLTFSMLPKSDAEAIKKTCEGGSNGDR